MKFAIIKSEFNETITSGLERGVREYLGEKDVSPESIDLFLVSGAFEAPLLARKLAETGRYRGIIVLGCVIKGNTAHFEFISLGATMGLQIAMQETGVPISFGILTTYDRVQAERRALTLDKTNKGREAAAACWQLAETLSDLK